MPGGLLASADRHQRHGRVHLDRRAAAGRCVRDRSKWRQASDGRRRPARLALHGDVDEVAVAHMATEAEILADLSARQRRDLVDLLRTALLTFDDVAAG
jgi:hypothetical protein